MKRMRFIARQRTTHADLDWLFSCPLSIARGEVAVSALGGERAVAAVALIPDDPRLSQESMVRHRALRDVASAVPYGLELALAIVGLVVCRRRRVREGFWLVALVLSFALGYAVFYGKLRYRIPVMPIVMGFAGVGLAACVERLRAVTRTGGCAR